MKKSSSTLKDSKDLKDLKDLNSSEDSLLFYSNESYFFSRSIENSLIYFVSFNSCSTDSIFISSYLLLPLKSSEFPLSQVKNSSSSISFNYSYI